MNKTLPLYSLILFCLMIACKLISGEGEQVTSVWPTPTASPITSQFSTFQPTIITPSDNQMTEIGETPITAGVAPRPWPETSRGVHVFNDQIVIDEMSAAQLEFVASHYAGVQKITRSAADSLRRINPAFLVLHYRLGLGLGYQGIDNQCQPNGEFLHIIEGDTWVQEWPGEYATLESWFYHYPEDSQQRVLNCDWGWYLMELDDADWRNYFQGEVIRQLQANDNDGLFMDSLSVPNYFGADRFDPPLPEVDRAFEAAWSRRIQDWLGWLQSQPVGQYALIPNVGSWIVTRDATDYSQADGVMVEGFAMDGDASPYNLEDWVLQANRILSLTAQDKIILGQSYVTQKQERMFTLGTYLLLRGQYSYLNLELDYPPEWWSEYDLPIGAALESAGTDVTNLYDPDWRVYRRNFDNGFVLVNPTNPYDGNTFTAEINLGGNYYLAVANGGGFLPDNAIPNGSLSYQAVTQLSLPPYSAAVLFNQPPQ